MMKKRGQKNLLSGAYIQMDHLIGRLEGPVSYYYHLKETWLNAWSTSTLEYEVLVAGLNLTKVAGATSVVIYCEY